MGERGIIQQDYAQYREEKTEEAKKFQDFVCEYFSRHLFIPLTQFSSRHYQYKTGETMQGVEIKHDMRLADTGNVYIEIAEKSHPLVANYSDSGIYRNDNTWIYLIGNYNIMYLFIKKQLRTIHERKIYSYLPNPTPTSKGFLLSRELADKYCAHKIIIENDN